jgi:regulatory associated protein of mTOR
MQEAAGMVGNGPGAPGFSAGEDPMRECILLAACGAGELLPQNPELPADVFTACLTTPIKVPCQPLHPTEFTSTNLLAHWLVADWRAILQVALRWFCNRSLLRGEGLAKELIDRIPGKQTDRRTPLGELNWIFTAITDTIAWNMLPRALFQKLFRQVSMPIRWQHEVCCQLSLTDVPLSLWQRGKRGVLERAGPAGGKPVSQLPAG